MYDFETQNALGKKIENHFFKHLEADKKKPKFNPASNNKDYDIIALGLKYEVKADYYNNTLFPIELCHVNNQFSSSNGWLYHTESDYVIFYKTKLRLRFWISTKELKKLIQSDFDILKVKKTANKGKMTINAYLSEDDLSPAIIHKDSY